MSYKNAGREDIDEAAAALSLNCAAHGCPLRWSVSPDRLCNYHAWEDPKKWPGITEALNRDGPWQLDRKRSIDTSAYRGDPLGWAKRLRDRHQRGEHLTSTQVSMYRDALRMHLQSEAA